MQKKVQLTDVVITAVLESRQARVPNLFAENTAFLTLASDLGKKPKATLQSICQTARELAAADIAGISTVIDQNGIPAFRWDYLSGESLDKNNATRTWDDSPCGYCLDTGSPQLFLRPDRYFNFKTENLIEEALVVPIFDQHDKPLAALWIGSFQASGKFDQEDVKLLAALAGVASAAIQLLK
jgi:GAF domain-containing protein